jgi:hypothetical protein
VQAFRQAKEGFLEFKKQRFEHLITDGTQNGAGVIQLYLGSKALVES